MAISVTGPCTVNELDDPVIPGTPTPWMTQEILKAKVRVPSLGKSLAQNPLMRDRSRYRVQFNLCNRIMGKAKANYLLIK